MNFDEILTTLESGENLAAEVPANLRGCRAFVGIIAYKDGPLGVALSNEQLSAIPWSFKIIRMEIEPSKLEYDVHHEDLSELESFVTKNLDELKIKLTDWIPDKSSVRLMYQTDYPL